MNKSNSRFSSNSGVKLAERAATGAIFVITRQKKRCKERVKGASTTMPNMFICLVLYRHRYCVQFIARAQNIIVLRIIISCKYLVRLKDKRNLETHSCCAHFIRSIQILL